jgi:drug/metabolite transporter (DMT)-like permease
MLGVGVVSTFVAISTFYAGTRRIGAAQASIISTVEPIWTIVLAYLLFGFGLTPPQLVGGALIIGGVLVAQTGPGSDRALTPAVRLADE